MDIAIEQLNKEEEELEKLNQELKTRSQKFGSEFKPLTMSDYKLFKIRKARETGKIQYLDNILLEEIEDLQERKKKIQKRLEQFYPELKVQSEEKFFNERQVPNFAQQNVEIRPNVWHLFGVDYMSNQLIRNYFYVNPHFKIEWINDSSCNIVFQSKEQAQQAMRPHIKGVGMKDEADIWYQLGDYEVQGIKRRLYCRLGTNKDSKKQESHGHNSQYYRWVINKQKLGNYVKRQAYNQIRKTKGINRQNKYHKTSNTAQVKRQQREKKEEEENSSSGVDDSDQKMG